MRDKVLLFPNFQRSFGFTATPFFEQECKGKGLSITGKIISEVFSVFPSDSQMILLKNSPIFIGGGKNTVLHLHNKVFDPFLFTSIPHSYSHLQELSAPKTGVKDTIAITVHQKLLD
jgi:hypothetical protein